jgi:alkylhydroperoxidase family enzyme
MSDEQHAELLSIVGMAAETNALANALQVSVDPEFLVS